MPVAYQDYRDILKSEFQKRCELNPKFSLRSFAAKLDLPVSTLSEVLNMKQGLSKLSAEKIATKLGYSKSEKIYFILLVESMHARSKTQKEIAISKLKTFKVEQQKTFDLDSWKIISEWQHLAIWEMSRLTNFKADPLWIAKRLNISIIVVRESIIRLVKLGLLKITKTGRFTPSGDFTLILPHDIPSDYTKNFHSQIIKKSLIAMYQQELYKRNYSTVIVSTNKSKIREAKQMIMDFNKTLNNFLNNTDNPDTVYCISTQLFELVDNEISKETANVIHK